MNHFQFLGVEQELQDSRIVRWKFILSLE